MISVGVFGNDDVCSYTKNLLIQNYDVTVMPTEPKRFNVLILLGLCDFSGVSSLLKLQESCDLIAISTDAFKDFKFLHDAKAKVLTFGFNTKSCIRVSSVVADGASKKLLYANQHTFTTLHGKKIDVSEYSSTFDTSTYDDTYAELASITTNLYFGTDSFPYKNIV